MSLSLKKLMEDMTGKGGYNVTPGYSHLQDLKGLLNDMITIRDSGNCIGHSLSSYNDVLSLGDLNDQISQLKACSCNINTATVCYCQGRTYASTCSCNDRTGSCDCESRTSTSTCSCNDRTGVCDCESRTGEDTCDCYGRTNPVCDCQGRTASNCTTYSTVPYSAPSNKDCYAYHWCVTNSGPSCNCQSRDSTGIAFEIYCDCYTRTGVPCDCNGRTNPICDCQTRRYVVTCTCDNRATGTGYCDCETRTGASTCTCDNRATGTGYCYCEGRTYAPTCSCNGRCSCDTEQRFE